MLEEYFMKPATVDRFRGSWIGAEIETYGAWLVDQGYGTKSIWRRVPIAFAFGEFAQARGAKALGELPAHVEAFVTERVERHHARTGSTRVMAKEIRGPVEQLLSVVLSDFEPTGRTHHAQPFANVAPGFFDYLVEERGLRPASVNGYRFHLDRLNSPGVDSTRAVSFRGYERVEGSPLLAGSALFVGDTYADASWLKFIVLATAVKMDSNTKSSHTLCCASLQRHSPGVKGARRVPFS
jgi:hypothetical protein